MNMTYSITSVVNKSNWNIILDYKMYGNDCSGDNNAIIEILIIRVEKKRVKIKKMRTDRDKKWREEKDW